MAAKFQNGRQVSNFQSSKKCVAGFYSLYITSQD